ncbi:MAG: ATP-binding protein [Candidatus Thorarchaeota archaeon]|nr:ATP-binding protein [Candidatus Thorarchaeota archaeon]
MSTEDIGEVIDFLPNEEVDSERIRQYSVAQKSQHFIDSLKEYERIGKDLNNKVNVFSGSALLLGCEGTDFLGFAENVALNVGANIVKLRLSQALSKAVDTPLALRTLFEFASRNSPSLIFLEELDIFAEDATNNAAVLKAALSRIDWALDRTAFVGYTTRPRNIDRKIRQSIDRTYVFEKTTTEDRIRFFEAALTEREDLDPKSVAEVTEGWSYSDLRHLVGYFLLMKPREQDQQTPSTLRAQVESSNILPVGKPQIAEAVFKEIEEGYRPKLEEVEEVYPNTLLDQLYLMAVGDNYVRTQEVIENLNKSMPLSADEQQFLNKYPFLLQGEAEDRLTRLLRAKKTHDRLSRVLGR